MNRSLFFLVAGLVVLSDQASKFLVREFMVLGQSIPAEGPVRLTYVTNKGGAFSFFSGQPFFMVVPAVIALFILLFYLRSSSIQSNRLRIGLGLSLGGAVGNLIDRLRFGEVTDFIDLGAWPVSNIADTAVVTGTVLIALYLLSSARTSDNANKQPGQASP